MVQKIIDGSQRLVGNKRGFSRIEAATFVGISPSKFDDLVKDGRMPRARQIDGRKVWDLCELNPAFDVLGDVDTSWD
jgi:predicted DNA-binding transcriptional regulator AlpA